MDFDAETFAEQAVLVGLITRDQIRAARDEADDGTLEAMTRALTRKGLLTSWQRDRLLKGDLTGFFMGGCKLLFHIAEGTFARVYRGVDSKSRRAVAVKVLRRRFTTDASAVQRFNHEAEAGMRLVHPNIVRIFDYGETDGNHYIIMEYVEGSNLRDFLKIRHRVDLDAALPMILGLARALEYSLDQGVTHRDIKGTNILVSTKGEAKLVDFGLATLGDEHKMEIAHGQRTVDYSALERTCGSPKGDFRSDIFFLGCVFYQMLTGLLPLPEVEAADPLAKMLKRSFGAIRPLHELRHAPPLKLCKIIEGMMQVDVRKRYQVMRDVVADLVEFEQEWRDAKAGKPLSAKLRAEEEAAAEDDSFADLFVRKDAPPAKPEGKSLLCVEAQEPIRDAFRAAFTKLGYSVILVGDAARAAERYREAPPSAVVFDADGLGPEGLDAFLDMHEKAHEDGHDLAALVILSPTQADLPDRLPLDDRLVILKKPLKLKQVQEALTRLVPLDRAQSRA